MKTLLRLFRLTAFLLTLAPGAQAATLTVTSTADSGAGTLRNLVASANPGDTIIFNNTLSGQTITLTTGEIPLNKNLTVDASGLQPSVGLDGSANSRIFDIQPGATIFLTGLTITNGKFASFSIGDGGGGVRNAGNLTISRCTIVGNPVTGNTFGGGVWNAAGGFLTVNQCTIANNSSAHYAPSEIGGGIFNEGLLTVNQSTIAFNKLDATSPRLNFLPLEWIIRCV